ncbi:hypothetical protein K523DRAFT_327523 [Schizophyllum commune Tattone D]|nr:hypothetical protein K523DRAFT_327523 [Schizophyllum commune Tattone D]
MYLRLTPSWCCILYATSATAWAGPHAGSQPEAPLSDVSSLRPAMGQAIFAPIIRGMDAFINVYADIPFRRETPLAAPELQRILQDIRTTAAGVDVVFWNIMWLQDDFLRPKSLTAASASPTCYLDTAGCSLQVIELPTPSDALRDSISRVLPSIEHAIASLSLYCVSGSRAPGGVLDRLGSVYELFGRKSHLDLIPCRQRLKIAVLESALEDLTEMLEDDDAILDERLVELEGYLSRVMQLGEKLARGADFAL